MWNIFSQSPFRVKLDWGAIGAERAAGRGDIIIIVDVLSFSTTVAHAVSRGAIIFPRRENEEASTMADKLNAELAVSREGVPSQGHYSLSPLTFNDVVEGTKVLLPSLNGATCSRCAEHSSHIIVGALVNAKAAAKAAVSLIEGSELSVTVIACGEREKGARSDLRMAIEDYLGAGAVLSNLPHSKSPEAQVCESAFADNKSRVDELLWDSISGRELREMGFEGDVSFASRLDSIETVPVLKEGAFERLGV